MALRKTKKEWETCGGFVASMCMKVSKAMDETDVRVQKVGVRISRVRLGRGSPDHNEPPWIVQTRLRQVVYRSRDHGREQ